MADPFFSGLILAPHLPMFCAKYPDLEIEINTRDSIGDLVSDGMDLSVRFGAQPASSMVALIVSATALPYAARLDG